MRNRPMPVSIGIIPSITPGQVILIERTDGGIALPGGYVEELETAITAVNREAFEEMGLELDPAGWQLFSSAVTSDNKLLLFSYYQGLIEVPHKFVANEEVVRVFSAPWNTPLKFHLHEAAIRKWIETACIEA